MLRAVSRGLDRVYLWAGYAAGALLVGMCALVVYSILARRLGLYAGGATDVAGYVMATSTFLGLAYAFSTGGHIRVLLVVDRLGGAARRGLEIACLAVMSAVTLFLAWYMACLALDSYVWGEVSEGADAIPLWIPQTPVAVGAALFALSVLHALLRALFDWERVRPDAPGPGGG